MYSRGELHGTFTREDGTPGSVDVIKDPDTPVRENRVDLGLDQLSGSYREVALDTPGFMTSDRGSRIVTGKFTFDLVFRGLYRGISVCEKRLTLILTIEDGKPHWSTLQ